MRQASEAQFRANRENAKYSTGPKSAEGKERSRANALKHGMCAVVVPLPGEDPEAMMVRFEEWNADLNPRDRAAQSYLVLHAVRQSRKLDRFDTSQQWQVAKRVRDAHKTLKASRLREVDECANMMNDPLQSYAAIRRLKSFTEGCEYLLIEWTLLYATLVPPAHWDAEDDVRMNFLIGTASVVRKQAASPSGLATIAITRYRKIFEKLEANKDPNVQWPTRYEYANLKASDENQLPSLYQESETHRLELIKVIDGHVAELTALVAAHKADDALYFDDVPYQAALVSSDEDKLTHRYEIEAERSLLRCLKEIRELNKADGLLSQPVKEKQVTPDSIPSETPRSTPPPARNEPNQWSRDELNERRIATEAAGVSFLDFPMVPPKRPENQR